MAMDLIASPSPTSVSLAPPPTSLPRNRTPDSDPDTPPPPLQPYPKWAHHNHLHAPVSAAVVVTYKECLKNHAASIGGHALDGCCEFMPSHANDPSDPTTLKCGACGCHRNFHRRDPDDPTPLHHHPPAARGTHSPPSPPRLLLSLSGHGREVGNGVGGQNGNFTSGSRKRFRTRFSQEQKEKMYEFSERIGWKLKRGEEKLVQEFCKQVGVGKSVFKVWMHNNKHNSIRKDNKLLLLDVGPNNININDINVTYSGNSNDNKSNNSSSNGVMHHDFYSNGVVVQEQEQDEE